jgi:hypothetical protein
VGKDAERLSDERIGLIHRYMTDAAETEEPLAATWPRKVGSSAKTATVVSIRDARTELRPVPAPASSTQLESVAPRPAPLPVSLEVEPPVLRPAPLPASVEAEPAVPGPSPLPEMVEVVPALPPPLPASVEAKPPVRRAASSAPTSLPSALQRRDRPDALPRRSIWARHPGLVWFLIVAVAAIATGLLIPRL